MLAVGRSLPRPSMTRGHGRRDRAASGRGQTGRARQGRGRWARVLALCGLLLVAPLAGWMGAALAADGGALARSVLAALPGALGAGDQLGAVPVPGSQRITGAAGGARHQYWQAGLAAGPAAQHVNGMRTTIRTRLPEAVADRTTDYFWVGSYLDDGSFIQVGYYVSWYDRDTAGWFYCAFAANGRKGPCVYGPGGSAGANGTAHTYTLEIAARAGNTPARSLVWRALMDGKPVGQFTWSSYATGPNTPSVYAESSGFSPHPSDSQLGPVDFTVPLEVRLAGRPTYSSATDLRPTFNAPDICPPYGVTSDGHGGALIGSGLACGADAPLAR